MGSDTRTSGRLPSPGPFMAEITNHLDPSYMGGLEVILKNGYTNPITSKGNTFTVRYLSPFYGVTSVRFEGNTPNNFDDVQKSYGMWMVPPDIGTTVMVIFIDGDPNQGYWIGCAQDVFQNHMVPGIAASSTVKLTAEQRQKYGTDYLPVAEYNKKTQTLDKSNINNAIKPVHPFADVLLKQGLLLDNTRGVTSSSARREIPSGVFGISTPGPLDKNGPYKKIGYTGDKTAPVSRLGGTTFVMDDGDIDGENELVRIRTRTGHQILLHNTKDLIYIANSKGTAWIELTSNGKIDIFAEDSVSIHTKKDFNFRADNDVNIEAGGNINMSAGKNFQLDTGNDFTITAGGSGMLTLSKNLEVSSSGNNNLTSGGNTNILSSGVHSESASQIHMNGPAASAAATASPLPTYSLPNTDSSAAWSGNNYKTSDLKSIMTRVPTHEPWPGHES